MEIDIYSEIPMYQQLKVILIERIESGEYPVNTFFPGENELAKEFKLSRVTVRNALAILEKKGYIIRKAGLGTYVNHDFPALKKFTSVKSFTSEMKESGQESATLDASLEEILADTKLANIFHCQVGEKIYRLCRLRGSQNEPIVFSESYLYLPITLPNDDNFLYGSLYSYLLKKNITFSNMKEVLEAKVPTKEIKKKLMLHDGQVILKRTRYSYAHDNKVLEYTVNYYNAKLYRYTIEINS